MAAVFMKGAERVAIRCGNRLFVRHDEGGTREQVYCGDDLSVNFRNGGAAGSVDLGHKAVDKFVVVAKGDLPDIF